MKDQDNNFGFGTAGGYDGLYQSGVQATSAISATWLYPDGSTQFSGTSSANVSASITGAGTGSPGDPDNNIPADPNPASSAQIQINVQHSTTNTFVNNTAQAFNPNVLLVPGASASRTTSGNQGGDTLAYSTGNVNGGAGATLTATFQVSLSATGDNGKFSVGASLTLNSTFLSVKVDQNGLVATGANGAILKNDPNFQATLPYNASATVTVNVPNVANNTT